MRPLRRPPLGPIAWLVFLVAVLAVPPACRLLRPVPRPPQTLAELTEVLSGARPSLLVVPAVAGSPENGVYICARPFPPGHFLRLLRHPQLGGRWEGVVHCEHAGAGSRLPEPDIAAWGEYGMRAGPLLFFGDPRLLAEVAPLVGGEGLGRWRTPGGAGGRAMSEGRARKPAVWFWRIVAGGEGPALLNIVVVPCQLIKGRRDSQRRGTASHRRPSPFPYEAGTVGAAGLLSTGRPTSFLPRGAIPMKYLPLFALLCVFAFVAIALTVVPSCVGPFFETPPDWEQQRAMLRRTCREAVAKYEELYGDTPAEEWPEERHRQIYRNAKRILGEMDGNP
jgi:hypothetical protein